jgi:hypothetical protein
MLLLQDIPKHGKAIALHFLLCSHQRLIKMSMPIQTIIPENMTASYCRVESCTRRLRLRHYPCQRFRLRVSICVCHIALYAPPHRTVHEVLPHTALRLYSAKSPLRVESDIYLRPGQCIALQVFVEIKPVEARPLAAAVQPLE